MANANKKTVEYGVDRAWIYPIVNGVHTTGFRQLGMRAFKRDVTQDDTKLYADDEVYITVSGAKNVEGELTFYKINDATWELLGWEIGGNGVIADSGIKRPFGFAFITKEVDNEGNLYPRLIVCPSILGSEPAREKSTLEDTVSGEDLVIKYVSNTLDGFVAESGEKPTMFQVSLEGWTMEEVDALLAEGIPLPTDDFTPAVVPATGTITEDNTSDTEVAFTYTYANGSDLVVESSIVIKDTLTSTVLDTIAPASVGVNTPGSFTGLTTGTEYTVELLQNTTVLDSFTTTTL